MRPFSKIFPTAPAFVGSYSVTVVSLPEELDFTSILPAELRFVFRQDPEVQPQLRAILSAGKAVGIRTILRTPPLILNAVRHIAELSQHNCVLTWLTPLLRDKHRPIFNDADHARAANHGIDLNAEVDIILSERLRFKRFVLIDEDNLGIGETEQRLMTRLSELVYPLAIENIVHRIVADNAHERTEIAQSIIKALFVIGPIAHVLEKYASGIGKVFAASTDDLLGEAAEIMALRGSGFSWRTLGKRIRILLPVFALATYGAFQVEPILESGRPLLAGAVFGLSAVALSLTTAIQSLLLYRTAIGDLATESKLHLHSPATPMWRLALIQDFTNPARLGLLIGAAMAPIMGMLGATLGLLDNGWALAAIGSTESIVAGLTVISANKVNDWRLQRRFERYARGEAQ